MNEYALYYWLLHRYGVGNYTTLSIKEIQAAIGCIDWVTIAKARKRLVEKGLLDYQRGSYRKGGGRGLGAGKYRILRDLLTAENQPVNGAADES